MLLENLGKFFISRMRPPFFFLLTLLPLFITTFHILGKQREMNDLENRYETTLLKAHHSLEKRHEKERFLARHCASDPYFLDQHIESFHLLQEEVDWLKSCQKHPALPDKRLITERLTHLLEKNKISFIEEEIRTGKGYKETDEKMRKGVEMDESDIKRLLSLVEDLPIGPFAPLSKSPQLIITDFQIRKKSAPLNRETHEVKINLLKREFNP